LDAVKLIANNEYNKLVSVSADSQIVKPRAVVLLNLFFFVCQTFANTECGIAEHIYILLLYIYIYLFKYGIYLNWEKMSTISNICGYQEKARIKRGTNFSLRMPLVFLRINTNQLGWREAERTTRITTTCPV
jgi:hypothetical protein